MQAQYKQVPIVQYYWDLSIVSHLLNVYPPSPELGQRGLLNSRYNLAGERERGRERGRGGLQLICIVIV